MPAGTFRARFIIFSTTGDAFTTSGAGDNAVHEYNNPLVDKTGVINYILFGNCFYLDGSIVPVSYAGLPTAFTPTGLLSITTPGFMGHIGAISIQNSPGTNSGALDLVYGVYSKSIFNNTHLTTVYLDVTDINGFAAIDLIGLLSITATLVRDALFRGAAIISIADVIDVSGTYTYVDFTWTIEDSQKPIKTSEPYIIRIASSGGNPLDLSPLTAANINLLVDNGVTTVSFDANIVSQTASLLVINFPELMDELLKKTCTPVAATLSTLLTTLQSDLTAIGVPTPLETLMLSIVNDLLAVPIGTLIAATFASILIPSMIVELEDSTSLDDSMLAILVHTCVVAPVILQITEPPGTQFSGTVTLGTLYVLLENASGIYRIVADKRNDTLYENSTSIALTEDVKIPNPYIKTGFIGG